MGQGLVRAVRRGTCAVLMLTGTAGCSPLPDTVGEAAPNVSWRLVEIDDAPADIPASLRLLSGGRVVGAGPCGRFTATQTAPLPWVSFEDFEPATPRCPDAVAQLRYLTALAQMDFAEIAGDNMLLTNAAGRSLFFRAGDAATAPSG